MAVADCQLLCSGWTLDHQPAVVRCPGEIARPVDGRADETNVVAHQLFTVSGDKG